MQVWVAVHIPAAGWSFEKTGRWADSIRLAHPRRRERKRMLQGWVDCKGEVVNGERVTMATLLISLCHCTLCPQGSMMSCSRSCVCSHGTNVEESTWYGVDSYRNLFYQDCVGTALSDNPEGPLVQYTYQPWPSLCWKVRPKE